MWSRWGPYHVARFRGAAAVAKAMGVRFADLRYQAPMRSMIGMSLNGLMVSRGRPCFRAADTMS